MMRDLTTWAALQKLPGLSTESGDLDFKATLDTKKPDNKIEVAKDVAALANTLGGHVIIGAVTVKGGPLCAGVPGISAGEANEVFKLFEEQVKARCRPTPVFSVLILPDPGGNRMAVVVVVEPSPFAPIGVSLRQDNAGKLVDEGWAFPRRVGSLTAFLQPDQFGVYESMSARRAAAMLGTIPENERLNVRIHQPFVGKMQSIGEMDCRPAKLVAVDLQGNAAGFLLLPNDAQVEIPLDQIQSVWRRPRENNHSWTVSIHGSLRHTGSEWAHFPSV